METFLNYIQNETEGVIFATGSKVYVDKVMVVFVFVKNKKGPY